MNTPTTAKAAEVKITLTVTLKTAVTDTAAGMEAIFAGARAMREQLKTDGDVEGEVVIGRKAFKL